MEYGRPRTIGSLKATYVPYTSYIASSQLNVRIYWIHPRTSRIRKADGDVSSKTVAVDDAAYGLRSYSLRNVCDMV
jgi:hypothetical protein